MTMMPDDVIHRVLSEGPGTKLATAFNNCSAPLGSLIDDHKQRGKRLWGDKKYDALIDSASDVYTDVYHALTVLSQISEYRDDPMSLEEFALTYNTMVFDPLTRVDDVLCAETVPLADKMASRSPNHEQLARTLRELSDAVLAIIVMGRALNY